MSLTRRSFLAAGAAGLAAGALPPSLLKVLASPAPACGRLKDIEHVVILIQENRSFDHYFGRFHGVRGFDDRSVRLPDGSSVFEQPQSGGGRLLPFHIDTAISPGRPGECTNDVEHQWLTQHESWDLGRMDAWVTSHERTNGPGASLVMGYYERNDLEFYYALADQFTICDEYHCSVIGGTDINRLYTLTGTMDPDGFDGGAQFLDTRVADRPSWYGRLGTGHRWITYPEQLQSAGVSWKVYASADAQATNNVLMYFRAYQQNPALAARAFGSQNAGADLVDFRAECAAGTLPQVSWLLAPSTDDEHPPAPIEWGQSFSYQVLDAISSNPSLWAKTALFITYDENGGFFDHVPPPVPAPRTAGEYVPQVQPGSPAYAESGGGTVLDPIGLGFRVPMLVVSPFSRGGFVSSDRFDHTSLLRFLERRFGVEIPGRTATRPGLSDWRRSAVGDLTSAFNFAAAPDASKPVFPLAATPNRADPRVLAECTITGSPGNLFASSLGAQYPVPNPQTMPAQEPGSPRRPSGLDCGPGASGRGRGGPAGAGSPPPPADGAGSA